MWDANAGASATVGVQSGSGVANQFSFDTPSLGNNFSIRWRTGQVVPSIMRLSPFGTRAGSTATTLRVLGRSFLRDAGIR